MDQDARIKPVVEHAVYLLERLSAARWEALRALWQAHTRGDLSYDAWRTATHAILHQIAATNAREP